MANAINSVNYNNNIYVFTTPYGSCSTAAGTAAKTVSVDNFSLETGARVAVKFTVTNTAGSPTLNVNSTGAKAIYYNGAAITAGYLKANKVYEFIYNGTQWDFVGDIDTNTVYTHPTSSGNKHIPSGGSSGQILRWSADGTATWSADNDTKNTAGSTNSSSKLFLIGATSQAANPQTYSHDTAYVGTDGCLYSNGTKVSVDGHTHNYAGSSSAGGAATTALTCTGNSATATKATQDGNGNNIVNTYATKTAVSSKLDKLTYEWNKQYNAGGTAGYLLIGSFPMYDSNVTIDIDSTTTTTYHGTVVIATQNVSETSMGSAHTITVYGDPTGAISDAIRVVWTSGSRNYNVYFVPSTWSKNLIHIRAIGNYLENTDTSKICTQFTTGTAPTTTSGLTVVNALKSNFAASSHTHSYAASSHNHAASNITSGTLDAARLPAATSSALGGVKVGSNITVSSGTISLTKANVTAALGYTPPTSDTNTTYSAGTGISLSGTTFSNSGVRSIATGSSNGTISVNTNGTAADVAVKGLGAAAYKAVTDSTSASAISTGTSLVTERDVYYGLPKINNSNSYTRSTSIYAPTAGGTSGYVLVGAGTTSAPTWKTLANAGIATSGHNHDSTYLKLSGGIVSGSTRVENVFEVGTNSSNYGQMYIRGQTGADITFQSNDGTNETMISHNALNDNRFSIYSNLDMSIYSDNIVRINGVEFDNDNHPIVENATSYSGYGPTDDSGASYRRTLLYVSNTDNVHIGSNDAGEATTSCHQGNTYINAKKGAVYLTNQKNFLKFGVYEDQTVCTSYLIPNVDNGIALGTGENAWYQVATERLYVYSGRITCKPTYDNTVTAAANMYCGTGGVYSRTTNTSSRTIKHDIDELKNKDLLAENLYDLPIHQFKYDEGIITDENDVRYMQDLPGFIIEEMDEIYPIAVDKPSDDVKEWSWNAQYLIPPMLKLIQNQKKMITDLEDRITQLEELTINN